MKRVVSVSLGSAKRNHAVDIELLGEQFRVERIGTDGDLGKAIQMVKDLDGTVDAFGMGGIDLYIQAGGRRYILREAKQIAAAAKKTPMLDGTGLKNTLERKAVGHLPAILGQSLAGEKVLMVCGIDRFGMAEAFGEAAADLTLGDLIFTIGIPIPIHSLRALDMIARVIAPFMTQLPFRYLYPTGSKQEQQVARGEKYFRDNRIIAGDFHFIRRFMPQDMQGKIVLTNTVTRDDITLLKERGVKILVTTTPELNGRSFGTNVMEALLVALAGGKDSLTADEYEQLLDRLAFKPRVEVL
ncbi:MAG TPA: quinate 5-dehydrogenase, partial [Bacillota bacterium]|nr:quinate 5-dehydrogenase [Bacillota bacterium]